MVGQVSVNRSPFTCLSLTQQTSLMSCVFGVAVRSHHVRTVWLHWLQLCRRNHSHRQQAGKHSLHTHLTAAGLRRALAPLRREHVLLLGHVLQPRPLHNRRSGVSHHPCGRFVWRIITLYCGNYLLCRLHCSPLCSSIFLEVTNSVRI